MQSIYKGDSEAEQESLTNIEQTNWEMTKDLNYEGKKLLNATLKVKNSNNGDVRDIQKCSFTLNDTVFTLGVVSPKDFYFMEIGVIEAEIEQEIAYDANGLILSIEFKINGNIEDAITYIDV
ncbi:MAG: hypothetical protein K2M17_03020 [Bacilli bacterium]|nr:hypothetical protein [Bacilli bacterium]